MRYSREPIPAVLPAMATRSVVGLLLALLCGCGRVGYDAREGGPGSVDASTVDGGAGDAGAGDAGAGDAGDDAGPGPDGGALGAWSAPVLLAELNTAGYECDPSLTADALEIFFIADRGLGGTDIWRAVRASPTAAFEPAIHVPELSTAGFESSPEISPDGLVIHFTAPRGGTYADVYRATRPSRADPFEAPVRVDSLATAEDALNLAVAEDELLVIIDRPNGGDRELFAHTRASVALPWGAAVRLAELGSPALDGTPTLAAGGRFVAFATGREGGSVIYESSRADRTSAFAPPTSSGLARSGTDPFVTPDLRRMVFCTTDTPSVDLAEVTR